MNFVLKLILPIGLINIISSCESESIKVEFKTLKTPISKAELGELLFFDPILSSDSSISCASCHKPEFAFADNTPFSKGVGNKIGIRNTPSAMNQDGHSSFFWDGRATTLEDQAEGPIENPLEMNLALTEAVKRLKRHSQYANFFLELTGKLPNRDNIALVLAEYERTLSTSNTPFDKFMKSGDSSDFRASEKRGQQIFNEKGKCFDCHFGPDFTGDEFKNIGLFNGEDRNDSGRFLITHKLEDLGKFKTPGLRNIVQTAPYMHDGSFKSLKEVIDYYNEPDKFVSNSKNRDKLLNQPLNLTFQEKIDLENFLRSLSDFKFSKN